MTNVTALLERAQTLDPYVPIPFVFHFDKTPAGWKDTFPSKGDIT